MRPKASDALAVTVCQPVRHSGCGACVQHQAVVASTERLNPQQLSASEAHLLPIIRHGMSETCDQSLRATGPSSHGLLTLKVNSYISRQRAPYAEQPVIGPAPACFRSRVWWAYRRGMQAVPCSSLNHWSGSLLMMSVRPT